MLVYLPMSYPLYAASILASNDLIRSSIAAAFVSRFEVAILKGAPPYPPYPTPFFLFTAAVRSSNVPNSRNRSSLFTIRWYQYHNDSSNVLNQEVRCNSQTEVQERYCLRPTSLPDQALPIPSHSSKLNSEIIRQLQVLLYPRSSEKNRIDVSVTSSESKEVDL